MFYEIAVKYKRKKQNNYQPIKSLLIKIKVGIFKRKMSEGKYACALIYRMAAFRELTVTLTIYSGNLLIFCNCKKFKNY